MKTQKIIHYVYDSGSGVVGQSLMRAKTEDFEKIFEHPEAHCFDLRGHLVHLPLYEVPQEILEKLIQAQLKGEMTFRRFIQKGEALPTEVPEETPPDSSKTRGPDSKIRRSGRIAFSGKRSAALKKAQADLKKLRARIKRKVPV